MTGLQIMGYISMIASLLPIALILSLKLYKNRSLVFLMINYLSTLLYNVMKENLIDLPPAYVKGFGVTNNLLDVPLAILFLLYFTKSPAFRKKLHITIMSFAAFEILTTIFFGFTKDTITIIMGPGIVILIGLSFLFFIDQIKAVIQFGKPPGKALMAASTLFLYGCFFIIYLFWYIFKTKDIDNAFLVYFFVVTVSSLLMSIGLLMEKKRFKAIDELNTARKELSMLYPNEKILFPKETAGSFEDDDQY
jgi:hypothetical protein